MLASDPYALIPPGKIYRALGKSTECGGCIRLFVERMRSDAQTAAAAELPADVLTSLRDLSRHSR
jgi:xanthine/CO dehydrogenase XdhC/CoxF family maturation factor